MPSNGPSSEQRDESSSRFKKWLREKYSKVHGFFFAEPPFYIRHFFLILVLLGVIGGAVALWIPSNTGWLRQGNLQGESEQKAISDLRLHFLYITGGIIAILTLLQTNWKNQVDRRKVDADIKKNKQDVEKNVLDHTRQVHAERRGRYTKAIEQLANEKATVRLGGIYTLVGLVDEWLADENVVEENDRRKEGQVIINNLCAYVRSPFTLAESREVIEASTSPYVYSGNLKEDKAKLREEQDVRRAIFDEISKRRSKISADKNKKSAIIPGAWNNFIFDFSGAPIFYSLGNLTIEKANFNLANFYGEANFFKTTFIQNAHFDEATFTQNANFSEAKFIQNVTFSKANFTQNTDFSKATFTQNANFSEAKFIQNPNFREAKFIQNANFSKANFSKADFIRVIFTQCANFSEATFTQNATFSKATFTQNANFSEATFTQNVTFSNATFAKNANFRKATFAQNATFGKVTFAQNVTFKKATFKKQGPTFAQMSYRARFSVCVNPKNRSFATNLFIPLGKAILNDVECFIPVGTVLYDPDSWDKEKQDYTHSEPAKLANHSNQGKNKAE